MATHPNNHRITERVMQALETASSGSPELDCMISYALERANGSSDQVTMKLLVMEGYSWDVISALWDVKMPPYSQSLDGRIEGENITLTMWSEKRGKWVAVHKSQDGEDHVAWAKSEVLARRLAALKGYLAQDSKPPPVGETAGEQPALEIAGKDSMTSPANSKTPEMADSEAQNWRVLF